MTRIHLAVFAGPLLSFSRPCHEHGFGKDAGMLRCLFVLAILGSAMAAETPGEFDIREVVPLSDRELATLRQIALEEPDIRRILADMEEEIARKGLREADPRPLEEIHYEGLVHTDPRRLATVENLREMDAVALLTRYWQATGDSGAATSLRRFIVAWAQTYRPTGNDVNENKLYPLLVAYSQLRTTFPEADRLKIDSWIHTLGEFHARAVAESGQLTNRYTKHVRLTALLGRILGRSDWQAAADQGIRRFVEESLYPDGTSRDLQRRDTLTYHASALKPILELAILAGPSGSEWYAWEAPSGGSLKKSVDYVVPYALGEKTREEWRNTTVDLDRRRAAAGIEEYRPGRLFDPADARELMEWASFFDPTLDRVVAHLYQTENPRFASWIMLCNEVVRRSRR